MISNIAVEPEVCLANNCYQNCLQQECQLCTNCMSNSDISNIHRAFREHSLRGGFKRIFPSVNHFTAEFMQNFTINNQISVRWFESKCRESSEWCWWNFYFNMQSNKILRFIHIKILSKCIWRCLSSVRLKFILLSDTLILYSELLYLHSFHLLSLIVSLAVSMKLFYYIF